MASVPPPPLPPPPLPPPPGTSAPSSTTYQGPRFLANPWAPRNIPDMSATEETSHPDMSPLKVAAAVNICDMSVTEEVSQPDRSPSNMEANLNISDMSVTADRSGASAALYTMFDAPLNAPRIVSHRMSPHCSMDCSFGALAG